MFAYFAWIVSFHFHQEQDSQFRYIALELCLATVQEYVENKKFDKRGLDSVTLLSQATAGVAHLHALDIGNMLNRLS